MLRQYFLGMIQHQKEPAQDFNKPFIVSTFHAWIVFCSSSHFIPSNYSLIATTTIYTMPISYILLKSSLSLFSTSVWHGSSKGASMASHGPDFRELTLPHSEIIKCHYQFQARILTGLVFYKSPALWSLRHCDFSVVIRKHFLLYFSPVSETHDFFCTLFCHDPWTLKHAVWYRCFI